MAACAWGWQFVAAEFAGGLLMIDLAALAVAVVLGWRFLRTGGVEMLRSMEHAPVAGHEMVHDHDDHQHH